MKDKVLEQFHREALAAPGSRVVCAVSGGTDSVALLHCLLSLADALQLQVAAAHYNHCLRGAESDEDEAFVRRLCASWGVELTVGRGDAASLARTAGQSLEEAARQLRYEFLRSQSGLIATAHNADDQVETVLLQLLRGTGLKGLGGMSAKNGRLIRPMLCVTRAEAEAYLACHGLPHREDGSNALDDALRNRLRHHVIPLLKQENPSLAETVGRMTGLLQQDEAYLARETEALLRQAARDGGWDCRLLKDAPAVLRRRAVRRLLDGLSKPAMSHVDAVGRLLDSLNGSAEVCLPGGVIARREYGLLRLTHNTDAKSFLPVRLLPGQEAVLPEPGLLVRLEGPVILEKPVDFLSTFAVKYDMMDEIGSLWIRPRQIGDRLRLPGGTKSLKRLMIDRKLPAARRPLTPVAADAHGVLAVFGLGADALRAAHPGDTAMILTISEQGEREK